MALRNVDPAPVRAQPRLRAETIGPWGLAALAIGITSPAMGLYALWGPMQVAAGPISPLVFLASLVMTLPTAWSYAVLNRQAPSAASAAAWLWVSANPAVGFQAGLAMATYFVMATVAQPLVFALFFKDFLAWCGVHADNLAASLAGVLLATIPIAWVALRGAEASIKTTVRLMIAETIVIVALSATILIVKAGEPGAINFAPFDPREATQGLGGFWAAMILGVLAFCGFDVVSTAAEEAKAPKEYLPKAILITVVGMALFWSANAWVFTLSTPPKDVARYAAEGLTAITPLANAYWGAGSIVIIITAFTAITAVYVSCMQGASRILFALARQGLLPEWLARLEGENRVPRNAVLAILIAVIVLDVVTLLILENGLDSFVWWANALVFFAALTFLGVNAANILYFRRIPGCHSDTFQNVIVPGLGVLMNAYLIYAAFFVSLWSGPVRTGKSVVIGCVAILAIEILLVLYCRTFRRERLSSVAPVGVGEGYSSFSGVVGNADGRTA